MFSLGSCSPDFTSKSFCCVLASCYCCGEGCVEGGRREGEDGGEGGEVVPQTRYVKTTEHWHTYTIKHLHSAADKHTHKNLKKKNTHPHVSLFHIFPDTKQNRG
jgi:hypothetical protein